MDRCFLILVINQDAKKESSFSGIEAARKVYNRLKDICTANTTSWPSPFPACSLSGAPAAPKWFFAIQATYGLTQFCSSGWDEVCAQQSDGEESVLSPVDSCASALQELEEQIQLSEISSHTELFEEAADCLHQLADKLPPPGRFLLDVIVLCEGEVGMKEFLPVIGSLKHMQAWHSAQMTIVTEHSAGWRTAAAYLLGRVCSPSDVEGCFDPSELWRGGLLIREKKFVSELLFEGFSLKWQTRGARSHVFFPHAGPCCFTDHMTQPEVFHYYQPILELIQLVRITDLPVILLSSTEFELALSSKSIRAKLLLEQLRTLRGEVGALFSLSCVVSVEAFPPASQLSSSKWREFVAKHPNAFSAPDVKVKGEKGHYLVLVQGAESGGCKARLIHSSDQINGAVALGTIDGLVQEKVPLSSGSKIADWLQSLPRLCGDDLLRKEKRLARVQHQVVQECARRRGQEVQKPAAVPLNDLRVLLRLAREQYLKMQNATPAIVSCVAVEKENRTCVTGDRKHTAQSEWPERSVLRNHENAQKTRHKKRSNLFSSGSSDCLMGPKDGQKSVSAPIDARELLKHFTADGLPSGELQPLLVLRGDNAFHLSPDLTPRKVTSLPFRQAASAHYHGLEFCLDERKALERDCGFARLQSRLIRFETQTTCCKEPCPVPLALSPMPAPTPSPSERGSVQDTEAAQNEPARPKRRSRDPDVHTHQQKRLAKSESSESLVSQCTGGSGAQPAVRALQQQSLSTGRSVSCSSSTRHSTTGAESSNEPPASSQGQTESRSQKHNRMLKEVVSKTLKHYGISSDHKCFKACSQRLFDVSKLYLKDLKTSRGLHEEMRKAAGRNAKQVIDWVVEKAKK